MPLTSFSPLEVESPPLPQVPRPPRRRCCFRAARSSPLGEVEPDEFSAAEIIRRVMLEWQDAERRPEVADIWSSPGIGGRSRLLCRGRFVAGPPDVDRRYTTFALGAILFHVTFFMVACGDFLWRSHRWVLLSTVCCATLTLIMFFVTAFSDPGIIPRPALQLLVPGLQEATAAAIGLKDKRGGRREDLLRMGPNSTIMEELEGQGYWWCRWCHMVQPPRAKHCKDCNCCILKEDHHCPFLNNCIGQRNYATFYGFVVFLVFLSASFVVGISLWLHFEQRHCWEQFGKCLESAPGTMLLTGAALLLDFVVSVLLLLVTAFALWHLFLIIWGRTTREVLTGRLSEYVEEGNSCCSGRGTSLIQGSAKVEFPDLKALGC